MSLVHSWKPVRSQLRAEATCPLPRGWDTQDSTPSLAISKALVGRSNTAPFLQGNPRDCLYCCSGEKETLRNVFGEQDWLLTVS